MGTKPLRSSPGDLQTGQGAGNCFSDLFHTGGGDARRLIVEPPRERVAMNELARVSPHHLGELSPNNDDWCHPDGGAGAGSNGFAYLNGQAFDMGGTGEPPVQVGVLQPTHDSRVSLDGDRAPPSLGIQ